MTAIDFRNFVDQLAAASGDTILPFFRTALAIEMSLDGIAARATKLGII